jgi:hypothetical protein
MPRRALTAVFKRTGACHICCGHRMLSRLGNRGGWELVWLGLLLPPQSGQYDGVVVAAAVAEGADIDTASLSVMLVGRKKLVSATGCHPIPFGPARATGPAPSLDWLVAVRFARLRKHRVKRPGLAGSGMVQVSSLHTYQYASASGMHVMQQKPKTCSRVWGMTASRAPLTVRGDSSTKRCVKALVAFMASMQRCIKWRAIRCEWFPFCTQSNCSSAACPFATAARIACNISLLTAVLLLLPSNGVHGLCPERRRRSGLIRPTMAKPTMDWSSMCLTKKSCCGLLLLLLEC